MNISKQINKLFDMLGLHLLEEESLNSKIDSLTDNAKEALEQAIKNKEMNVIVGILGIKPITSIKRRDIDEG